MFMKPNYSSIVTKLVCKAYAKTKKLTIWQINVIFLAKFFVVSFFFINFAT